MLAAGKVSADDAERLLEKLDGSGAGDAAGTPGARRVPGARRTEQRARRRTVRLRSSTCGCWSTAPTATRSTSGCRWACCAPVSAWPCCCRPSPGEKLSENGIDLSHLGGDALVEELRELTVDVDSAKGDTVRVFCE